MREPTTFERRMVDELHLWDEATLARVCELFPESPIVEYVPVRDFSGLGDAYDEADTGQPPCLFCRRTVPCECAGGPCMCSCGRCMAPPLPEYRG